MNLIEIFKISDTTSFSRKLQKFSRVRVGDLMTKHVTTITPQDSLIDAANVMIGHHLSCLVVVGEEYDKPLGIITERDFLLKAPLKVDKLKSMKVKDIMTKQLVTVQESLPIIEANTIMEKHRFRKLIVTNNKKVCGIITQHDLVREMNEFYRSNKFRTSDSLSLHSVKQKPITMSSKKKIADAQKKMVKEDTGTVFVTENDKIIGMFTEFDFISQLALDPEDLTKQTLRDVMSFPVVAVNSEADLFDTNHLMLEKGFRRLPVLDRGKLLGKITQTVIRQKGFEIIEETLSRIKENTLGNVNYQKLKKPKQLVRKISGKVQEFTYV